LVPAYFRRLRRAAVRSRSSRCCLLARVGVEFPACRFDLVAFISETESSAKSAFLIPDPRGSHKSAPSSADLCDPPLPEVQIYVTLSKTHTANINKANTTIHCPWSVRRTSAAQRRAKPVSSHQTTPSHTAFAHPYRRSQPIGLVGLRNPRPTSNASTPRPAPFPLPSLARSHLGGPTASHLGGPTAALASFVEATPTTSKSSIVSGVPN
jgi:hypothetical protein